MMWNRIFWNVRNVIEFMQSNCLWKNLPIVGRREVWIADVRLSFEDVRVTP